MSFSKEKFKQEAVGILEVARINANYAHASTRDQLLLNSLPCATERKHSYRRAPGQEMKSVEIGLSRKAWKQVQRCDGLGAQRLRKEAS